MIVTPNAAPCPFCHASVIPSRVPYRAMCAGIAIAVIPMWMRYAVDIPDAVQYIAIPVGAVLIWGYGLRIKLEHAQNDEER